MSLTRYIDSENKFVELFNPKDGFYLRSNIIDSNGKDTGVDPFMRKMPNLLDIGIMGYCIHGVIGLCEKAGVGCYQSGNNIIKSHMKLDEYKRIIDDVRGHVFQVALGGRGDPNKHPKFEEILKYTRDSNIIPNYTTSGFGLTENEVKLTKEYCGAVAVSQYHQEYTKKAIDLFLSNEVTTNIHFVLSNDSINNAINTLENNKDVPKGIHAIIFLLHKPIGLGSVDACLSSTDSRIPKFFKLVDDWNGAFKLGFDSCSVSMLINNTKNVNMMSLDSCESSRMSAYISSDLMMVPCSFDAKLKWGVDLHYFTIQEAWESDQFNIFRNKLYNSCPSCFDRSNCYGGCPIVPTITTCTRLERVGHEN